jgi:hypothetical protein
MQDNVIIINGVALLGTNGWWTFDFDPTLDQDQSMSWWHHMPITTAATSASVVNLAHNDAAYDANSVYKLQTHQEVSGHSHDQSHCASTLDCGTRHRSSGPLEIQWPG